MNARTSAIFENSSIRNFVESMIELTDDEFDTNMIGKIMIQKFSLDILLEILNFVEIVGIKIHKRITQLPFANRISPLRTATFAEQ